MGEFIAQLLAWPVPGSVLGMLLLFVVLVIKGGISEPLKQSSNGLLPYLPLFIVPASVGIVNYMDILQQDGLVMALAMFVSLLVGIPVAGLIVQGMIKRSKHGQEGKQK